MASVRTVKSNVDLYPVEKMGTKAASAKQMSKSEKQTQNQNKTRPRKPRFGICFDVDGVLARGTIPLPPALKAFKRICDDRGDPKVPFVFVTNALNRNVDKAQQISNWLGIQVSPEQMIQAPGPLELFTKYHEKFCLVVGQGKIDEIAKELGFKRFCTVEMIAEAYPLLDMVDHDNRKRIATNGYVEKDFPRVEAIILLGEPKRWESALQILVDLLKTDGKPTSPPAAMPEKHLPVIACNMDLQFMDRACMPRFGHGAFLVCLEALYKKVTGHELKYSALVGKPSEITFRYAEHCLAREANKLGITEPLERMYLIGDTPEVDIVGSNLYQRYIDRFRSRLDDFHILDDDTDMPPRLLGRRRSSIKRTCSIDPELPYCRNTPPSAPLAQQSVAEIQSILVCTGVYQPGWSHELSEGDDEKNYQGHRDFPNNPSLYKPTKVLQDVDKAIEYILENEEAQNEEVTIAVSS